MSLTYGGSRKHIWTFASALDDDPLGYDHKCPCSTNNTMNKQLPITIPSYVGNDYFCESGVSLVKVGLPFMLMIHCGMVKIVDQLLHAAHSTIHHGFVNNYFSQLMLIWK